jgi:hypothetical protein
LVQSQILPSPHSSQVELARLSRRKCFLKGCDRYFSPSHHLDRFCADDCRDAARRWRLARANLKYRVSRHGKENRRAQAARYRIRLKERKDVSRDDPKDQSGDPSTRREGYRKEDAHEKSCCDRPGCYKRFTPPPRSPLQKFCSSSCYGAFRAVVLRERRWRERLAVGFCRARDGPQATASKEVFV